MQADAEDSSAAGWYPDPFGRHQHRYWDGGAWTAHVSDAGQAGTDPPHEQPPPAAVPAGAAAAQRNTGAIVVLVGAGVLALGSLLPWATVNAGFISRTINGTDGDGVLTLGAAGLIALLAAIHWQSRTAGLLVVTLIVGVIAGGIAIYDMVNISEVADDAQVGVSIGGGLYACVAGAGAVVAGSIIGLSPGTTPATAQR